MNTPAVDKGHRPTPYNPQAKPTERALAYIEQCRVSRNSPGVIAAIKRWEATYPANGRSRSAVE